MSCPINSLIGIIYLSSYILFSQGFKIDTDYGTEFIPDKMICNGRHWTEDEGKANMQKFSELWNDSKSWNKRAKTINVIGIMAFKNASLIKSNVSKSL